MVWLWGHPDESGTAESGLLTKRDTLTSLGILTKLGLPRRELTRRGLTKPGVPATMPRESQASAATGCRAALDSPRPVSSAPVSSALGRLSALPIPHSAAQTRATGVPHGNLAVSVVRPVSRAGMVSMVRMVSIRWWEHPTATWRERNRARIRGIRHGPEGFGGDQRVPARTRVGSGGEEGSGTDQNGIIMTPLPPLSPLPARPLLTWLARTRTLPR